MWLFTKYGFYSAVCARHGDGSHARAVDPGRIMVRSRLRAHLEGLQKRFPEELGSLPIMEFAGTDYPCRLFVDKAAWVTVVSSLVGEMDYDNFKGEVHAFQGSDASGYQAALHDVWGVMHRLQR